jgi:phosphohistidine phosphatase
MELLLIRHGQAVGDADGLGDDARWLTAKGRTVTRRVARWLAKEPDRRPAAILSSALVRAVQTAEIVAEAAGIAGEVTIVPELAPGAELEALLARVARHDGPTPLALVGHEPALSAVATRLLGAEVEWPGFKKSGVLAVRWQPGEVAAMRFLLLPKELRVRRELPRA